MRLGFQRVSARLTQGRCATRLYPEGLSFLMVDNATLDTPH